MHRGGDDVAVPAAGASVLSSAVGARTGYLHAMYFLGIQEPTVTILLFSLIALGAYQLSRRLPADGERLALVAARTALFLVNFGFWIGSLWGDRLAWLRPSASNTRWARCARPCTSRSPPSRATGPRAPRR